jgi:hypothetical protein
MRVEGSGDAPDDGASPFAGSRRVAREQ